MKNRGPRNTLKREGVTFRELEGQDGKGFVMRVLNKTVQPPQITVVVKQPGQEHSTVTTIQTEAHHSYNGRPYRGKPIQPEGTGAIARMLETYKVRNPLAQVALQHLAAEAPFPPLVGKSAEVARGAYELVAGKSESLSLANGQLHLFENGGSANYRPPWLPGVHPRGWYDHYGELLDVVSFLYHKLDANGDLETQERGMIVTGIGYGEYPGHEGQPATWYLVGPQIGTFDHQTGQALSLETADTISPKNFSVACITGGPLGKPILANPQ
jgi:hypothetical protein